MRRRVIELAQGRIVRDEADAALRAARRVDGRVRRADARAGAGRRRRPGDDSTRSSEAGVKLGFFIREAMRSISRNAIPSFAAMASVLVTVLVLGVFIPVVQATTGAANEVRGRVLVDVYLKTRRQARRRRARARSCSTQRRPRRQGRVRLQGSRPTSRSSKRNPEAYELLGLQPAARHVPRHARRPRRRRRAARRAGARDAERRPHDGRPGDRRGQEPQGRHARRSSPPRAS